MVHALLLGKSSAFFLFGAHLSGKTHTLRGGQAQERGLLSRVVEDVFTFFTMNRNQFDPPEYSSNQKYYEIN